MPANDTIIADEQSAQGYDRQARETHWFGPEVIFGLAYEFVKPGGELLDLGIGSGLSSQLFHQAGMRVYGLDGSEEVLRVCAQKQFTVELKRHDLRELPLPYSSGSFDMLLCVAVLNSFADLGPLFAECSRILRPQCIFAFTVEEQHPGEEPSYPINRVEVAEQPQAETAVILYRHKQETLTRLLAQEGLDLLKTLEFTAFSYPAEQRDVFFRAYLAQKTASR